MVLEQVASASMQGNSVLVPLDRSRGWLGIAPGSSSGGKHGLALVPPAGRAQAGGRGWPDNPRLDSALPVRLCIWNEDPAITELV